MHTTIGTRARSLSLPIRVRVPATAGVCLVDDPSLFARGTLLRFPQGVEKSDEAKTAAAAAKNTSFSSRRSHPGTHRTSWQHNTHTQMARETTEPRASFFLSAPYPSPLTASFLTYSDRFYRIIITHTHIPFPWLATLKKPSLRECRLRCVFFFALPFRPLFVHCRTAAPLHVYARKRAHTHAHTRAYVHAIPHRR